MPLITLLIPTRERAHVLEKCLQTCINQDWSDCEILVSDNASRDQTRTVIQKFSDQLPLNYINPGSRLGMSEHWEFAIAKVRGEYLVIIGDDDGLPTGSIATMKRLLQEHPTDAIVWPQYCFCYPTLPDPKISGTFVHQSGDIVQVRDMTTATSLYLGGKIGYTDMPGAYHKLTRTSLIQKSISKGIRGIAPDILIATAVIPLVDSFLFSRFPLTIPGASPSSNGFATLSQHGNKQKAATFRQETSVGVAPPFDRLTIPLESNWHLMQLEVIVKLLREELIDRNMQVDYLEHLRHCRNEAGALPKAQRRVLDEEFWEIYCYLTKEAGLPTLPRRQFAFEIAKTTRTTIQWGHGASPYVRIGADYPDIAAAMPLLEKALVESAEKNRLLIETIIPKITNHLRDHDFFSAIYELSKIKACFGGDMLHLALSPPSLQNYLTNMFPEPLAIDYSFSLTLAYYIVFTHLDPDVGIALRLEQFLSAEDPSRFERTKSKLMDFRWIDTRTVYLNSGPNLYRLKAFGLLWLAPFAIWFKNTLKQARAA